MAKKRNDKLPQGVGLYCEQTTQQDSDAQLEVETPLRNLEELMLEKDMSLSTTTALGFKDVSPSEKAG